MQHQALRALGRRPGAAVQGVADDRVADPAQVHAQLVGAASGGLEQQATAAGIAAQHAETGAGGMAALGIGVHPQVAGTHDAIP